MHWSCNAYAFSSGDAVTGYRTLLAGPTSAATFLAIFIWPRSTDIDKRFLQKTTEPSADRCQRWYLSNVRKEQIQHASKLSERVFKGGEFIGNKQTNSLTRSLTYRHSTLYISKQVQLCNKKTNKFTSVHCTKWKLAKKKPQQKITVVHKKFVI